MKRIVFFVAVLMILYVGTGFSQDVYPMIERSTDWVLYQKKDGVEQYYKFQECNIPEEGFYREYVLIKLVNTTDKVVRVEWDIVSWYGNKCANANVDNPEYHRSVILQPLQTVEGTCDLRFGKKLVIFSNFLNYKIDDYLTHFELRNFKVSIGNN